MTNYNKFELDAARLPVIIAAKRSPIGRANGMLKNVSAEDLLSAVIIDIIQTSGVANSDVDDVVIGNAAGGGGNVARLAGLMAGLDRQVPGLTIDRQCGSGLEAINIACRMVMSGAGQIYLAGGVESVSTAPKRASRLSSASDEFEFYNRARFSPDSIGDPDMGIAAENVARKYNITRQRQDEFALQSHQRAINAQKLGKFNDEIVPIGVDEHLIYEDECPRTDTNLQKLSNLDAKFETGGTVTAGNSCPLNDGAAVVVVTSLKKAIQLGAKKVIEFVDGCTRGVDPNYLGIGPIASTKHMLARKPDINCSDLQFIEFNEAFAAQVLASLDGMEIASDRVNLDGGALALGHPFGASGAISVVRLFSQMLRDEDFQNEAVSLATLGTAGGMGVSTFFRSKKVS